MQYKNDTSKLEESVYAKAKQLMEAIIGSAGVSVNVADTPVRCRAIILNPQGDKLIVVKRQRPGQELYSVLPGGGLEEEDSSPLEGVQREINEELSLDPEKITFNEDTVLQYEDQWIYVGVGQEEFTELRLSGPELDRDVATSGTYELTWASIGEADNINLVPIEIRQVIKEASTFND